MKKTNLSFYYNNNFLLKINTRNDIKKLTNTDITKIFKTYIKRWLKIDYNDYLNQLGFNIKKCGFCNGYAYINIDFEIINDDVFLKEIEYPFNHYCKNKLKNCDGAKLNPNSIKFVSISRDVSEENALKIIKERNSSPFYKENFNSDDEYKKAQTRNLAFFKDKYEEVLGNKKYEHYLKKLKYSHSEQYYIDKLGEIKGKEHWAYLSSLKDSISYNHFLNKCNGDIEQAKTLYEKRLKHVVNTLERLIERHGIEKGTYKYGEIKENSRKRLEKRRNEDKDSSFTYVSKSSILFFDKLKKKLLEEKIISDVDLIQYGKNNEKAIYNELSGTCYFYDCFIKKYNLIIEYNGIKWHPKSIDDVNYKQPYSKLTTERLYLKDQHKIATAEKYKYDIIIVWEDNKNKLSDCMIKIKEIINKEK
jgi:hypothetical protein